MNVNPPLTAVINWSIAPLKVVGPVAVVVPAVELVPPLMAVNEGCKGQRTSANF
ncbi:hypothetical protein JFL60_01175 [Histophilus somni]|uniref:hypothetical protein n=1 Tax=Histophilus somni TaxID=731 RepID=UPI0018ECD365|nr:hypothetical protein [Histophilus somni]QQF65925.1 hypothetical protein JFL60_01175 [Histophilus somni]